MRNHSEIISDAGGPAELHRKLGYVGRFNTVHSWAKRKSIPRAAWPDVIGAQVATLEELAGIQLAARAA